MAENSAISWTDHTFNPWEGCEQISPACAHCYAKTLVERFGGDFSKRRRTSAANWKKPYKWNKTDRVESCGDCDPCLGGREDQCAVCRKQKWRVFSLSLGDWLDDEVPIEWLADFMKVIYETPNLDWLLLTKRPENWRQRVDEARNVMFNQLMEKSIGDIETMPYTHREKVRDWLVKWLEQDEPPYNVRIGITAENQEMYEKRLPHFLKIPAMSRFISIEPMLSKIDLALEGVPVGRFTPIYDHVHQIIVGGESGAHWKDRVLDLEATADIYAQCKQWGVKFFMKQDSGPRSGMRGRIPDELWVQEFPD